MLRIFSLSFELIKPVVLAIWVIAFFFYPIIQLTAIVCIFGCDYLAVWSYSRFRRLCTFLLLVFQEIIIRHNVTITFDRFLFPLSLESPDWCSHSRSNWWLSWVWRLVFVDCFIIWIITMWGIWRFFSDLRVELCSRGLVFFIKILSWKLPFFTIFSVPTTFLDWVILIEIRILPGCVALYCMLTFYLTKSWLLR